MSVDLSAVDETAAAAVRTFWASRSSASAASRLVGGGTRGAVLAGKNMDGFQALVRAVTVTNGLPAEAVYSSVEEKGRRGTVLPGFYRPLKNWDVLVVWRDELVAAVELKSQVGSFGNNFNNRAEEAVGMGEDVRVAYREGLLGDTARPFVGYLMLLQDSAGSTRPVGLGAHHFQADPVFEGASYAERYQAMCTRLMREGLYDSAALVLSNAASAESGTYRTLSEPTGLRSFCARLAARVSEVAAR